MKTICVCVLPFLLFSFICTAQELPAILLQETPQGVSLANQTQMVRFSRTKSGSPLLMQTFVRKGEQWQPMFDGQNSLAMGSDFDLQAERYQVTEDGPTCKRIILSGHQARAGYDWTLEVQANQQSPLFKFLLTCDLKKDLNLVDLEPVVALWMHQPAVELAVDQGPDSIYGSLGIPNGMGFPAAYCWDHQREAMIFFNRTPMNWLAPDGMCGFMDMRIQSKTVRGETGLGMHLKKLSGRRIAAGPLVIEFYLYSAWQPQRPTKLEALGRMVELCSPLHPSLPVYPANQIGDGQVSWEFFAKRAIEDLTNRDEIMWIHQSPWKDQPLELVPPQTQFVSHHGRATTNKGALENSWDFSTVNNHLAAWTLYSRVHPEEQAMGQLIKTKLNGLPRFYDPKARMIVYGTETPPRQSNIAMSWQNFFFYFETLRAAQAADPDDFNPAILGRFLMGTDGLIELAHRVDYLFPQFFDVYKKEAVTQADLPRLGVIYEPWQGGTYAYVMLAAYEMTGDVKYLNEAKTAFDKLLRNIKYSVSNEIYSKTYDDPADFPLTELFGNAYGLAAAQKLSEMTGERKWLEDSRACLNSLLRLTFWYEDQTDAVSRDLGCAGLFYPHCGAHVYCPWETLEANMGLAWALDRDTSYPAYDLLLKLSNFNRVNSYYFHPAVFSPIVQALDPERPRNIGQYFPIEPAYTLEGRGGHKGPTAAYMSGLTIWNDWLYEALARCTDREIMVLNLAAMEGYQEAVESAERRLIVFNPTDQLRMISIQSLRLKPGVYELEIEIKGKPKVIQKMTAQELTSGFTISLAGAQYARVLIRHANYEQMRQKIQSQRTAQYKIAYAYQKLQEYAGKKGGDPKLKGGEELFHQAMQQYRQGDYTACTQNALRLVETFDTVHLPK